MRAFWLLAHLDMLSPIALGLRVQQEMCVLRVLTYDIVWDGRRFNLISIVIVWYMRGDFSLVK